MSQDAPVDRAALHRLQKPWLELCNTTRYSPGVKPSIIDPELPQDKRKGEIVQVRLLLPPPPPPARALKRALCRRSCT